MNNSSESSNVTLAFEASQFRSLRRHKNVHKTRADDHCELSYFQSPNEAHASLCLVIVVIHRRRPTIKNNRPAHFFVCETSSQTFTNRHKTTMHYRKRPTLTRIIERLAPDDERRHVTHDIPHLVSS